MDASKRARARAFRRPAVRPDWDVPACPALQHAASRLGADLGLRRSSWPLLAALLRALRRAALLRATVRVSRRKAQPNYDRRMKIIDSLVSAGFARQWAAKPGRPKPSTRLSPTKEFRKMIKDDDSPWIWEALSTDRLVQLRDRATKEAQHWQLADLPAGLLPKLQAINDLLANTPTVFKPPAGPWRPLRTPHIAIFTADFSSGGRLYSGIGSHQCMPAVERQYIRIDGEQVAELDFQAMHPRMAYHLLGRPCPADPYRLDDVLGGGAAQALRPAVKVAFNALLNAKSEGAAVSACNQKLKGGQAVSRTAARAKQLRGLLQEWDVDFGGLLNAVQLSHTALCRFWFADMGLKLMAEDARIMTDVLWRLAGQGCPALSLHDGLLVPASRAAVAFSVMSSVYHQRFNFDPVIIVKVPS